MLMQDVGALERYCGIVSALKQKNVPPGGEAMMAEILAAIPHDAVRIVDLACNTGWVTREIGAGRPGCDVLGVDIDQKMIDTARETAVREGAQVRHACIDGSALAAIAAPADAIVCAGSAAFFGNPAEVYRGVAQTLRSGGVFADCHYLYDQATPAELRQRERAAFGLGFMPSGAAEVVAAYEAAGLTLQSVRCYPRFRFETSAAAALARRILLDDPRTRPMVQGMIERRDLIDELSEHRHPYLFVTKKGAFGPQPVSHTADLAKILAALDLFAEPVPAQRMESLRRMRPYEFLAYVGDPDAAPGGGRAVSRVADFLRELGLPQNSQIVDIGCFTGLSSIVLASRFASVTGIDIERPFLETAAHVAQRLGSSARFVLADGAETGFAAGSIDAITMTATLAYSPKPLAILAECHRVLKPDGLLVEFLYHHSEIGAEDQAAIRHAVGPDVRLSPLSQKLAEFERAGFRLVALDHQPTSSAGDHERGLISDAITAREARRDTGKSKVDLAEFRRLFELYAGRLSGDRAPPVAYLCVFAKEEGASQC
jgi:SAM-dependent methyltransferase